MSKLTEYNRKRNFKKTAEPKGTSKSSPSGRRFVIQKHDASRLHYDLRLEIGGALKSWAVPKGPSLDPKTKRLAVEVEDHPLAYGDFEGTIEKGEYGGGTVMLWDSGTYRCEGNPLQAYESGELKVDFLGERMKGKWALIRMKPKRGEEDKNWLLIKEKDDYTNGKEELTEQFTKSYKTGRSMDEIANGKKSMAKRIAMPKYRPQLATLIDKAPEGDEWLHEVKYDGYRILAQIKGGNVKLFSRNDLDWTDRFQSIAEDLEAMMLPDAVFDGEVTILDDKGISDFGALQNYVKTKEGELRYFVFDLLYYDGEDWTAAPLEDRKSKLKAVLPTSDRVLYGDDIRGEGGKFWKAACTKGLEGIVSKKIDAPYRQTRTKSWLKVKCIQRQEFVIGGYTDPGGSQTGFGALLLGYHEGGELVYCGKVGTGFDETKLQEIMKSLAKLKRRTSPFDRGLGREKSKGAHFIEPKLVCEVTFSSWTHEKKLRHPVFVGLRDDKSAKEITMEREISSGTIVAGINITHPERVIDPHSGLTKLDLAKYYETISESILPHLVDRPLALVRCPQGSSKECFFQKNFSETLPDDVLSIDLGNGDQGIAIDSTEGLAALAQFGVIEIHPWGSRSGDLDRPDRLTFDLDPSPELGWDEVVEAARKTRKVLEAIGLKSWVKTSGGKGLHVCVPIKPDLEWDSVKEFCHQIARFMEQEEPERYVSQASKSKRTGRIFVDYLRNGRGATSVAAFSARARPGIPVSVPIRWEELSKLEGAAHFTIDNLPKRIKLQKKDPWEGFFTDPQDLKAALTRQ